MGKGIYVFDYDGTLFNTMTVEIYAFNKTLEQFSMPLIAAGEIKALIGYFIEDIASKCLATTDKKLIDEFSMVFTDYEIEAIFKWGKLYENIDKLLKKLKKNGFLMEICTHGNDRYIDAHRKKFKLEKYFANIYTGDSFDTKTRMLKEIYEKHNADFGAMIGDRKNDIDAGKKNNFITIGTAYGFGGEEIGHADYIAIDAYELEEILISINKGK